MSNSHLSQGIIWVVDEDSLSFLTKFTLQFLGIKLPVSAGGHTFCFCLKQIDFVRSLIMLLVWVAFFFGQALSKMPCTYWPKRTIVWCSSSNLHHRFITVKVWLNDDGLVSWVNQTLDCTEQYAIGPHRH